MVSSLDLSLSQIIANIIPHSLIPNFIFNALSFTGSSIILWVLLVVGVILWEVVTHSDKRAFTSQFLKFFLTACFTLALTTISVTYIIKPIVGRDRPYRVLHIPQNTCPKDSSFPSGHAAAAAAGAFILAKFDHDKRRRVGYILTAIGIGYSRIYLYCHYVGDVTAGIIYGGAVAAATYVVVHYLYHKTLNPKL